MEKRPVLMNAPLHIKTTEECLAVYDNITTPLSDLIFSYCDFANNFSTLGLFIYLSWLVILFVTIGTAVDHFFCPSLEFIAKTFTLSQNVAGVTLLSFGNGAPEIFSSVAGAKVQRENLVIAGLFGSAMFLTCVVAGTIMCILPSFHMVEGPFLRDVIFFIVVAFWTYVCLYYRKMTLPLALSFIGVYFLYTAYVLLIHYVYQKYIKRLEASTSLERIPTVADTQEALDVTAIDTTSTPVFHSQDRPDEENGLKANEIAPWGVPPILRHWDSGDHHTTTNLLDDFDLFLEEVDTQDGSIPPVLLTSSLNETLVYKHETTTHVVTPGTFMLFLYGICPVNYHLWPVAKSWNKTLQCLRAPIVLALKLTIPIVTCDDHRLHNWCRPLNALHCVATPLFILFTTECFTESIYGWFQMWMLVLLVGSSFSIATLIYTVNSAPPRFLVVWAVMGFAASISWIYLIAQQIVILLTTFGKILELSDEILGLTILSWGNGIPDFIADFTVAKSGYPQMGISACFGGPLIIVLLGMGISFTIGLAETTDKVIEIQYGKMTTVFCTFLCASLLSALIIFPMMKFRTHKIYGVYLILLYVLFMIFALLHEFGVL